MPHGRLEFLVRLQQSYHFDVLVEKCYVSGRLISGVSQFQICTQLDQFMRCALMPICNCYMQRRIALIINCRDLSAVAHQYANGWRISKLCHVVQCSLAFYVAREKSDFSRIEVGIISEIV